VGFSFRKSFNLGPMRLNLSKSGIGVSAGVKGLRLSKGPRGTQLTAGRGPFRYQKTLSPAKRNRRPRDASDEGSDFEPVGGSSLLRTGIRLAVLFVFLMVLIVLIVAAISMWAGRNS
jgi:hypothetical protein